MTRPMETSHGKNYTSFLDRVNQCICLQSTLPPGEHYSEHPSFETVRSIFDDLYQPFEITTSDLPEPSAPPPLDKEKWLSTTPDFGNEEWLAEYESVCRYEDFQLAKKMPKTATYSNEGRASDMLRRIFRHGDQLLFDGLNNMQLAAMKRNPELNLARNLIGSHPTQDARIQAIRQEIGHHVPTVTAWDTKPTEAQLEAASSIMYGHMPEAAPSVKHDTLQDRWLAQLLEDDSAKLSRFLNQRWLVKGWIPAGAIGDLIGKSTVGKTFCAVDIGASTSLGTPCFGESELTTGEPGLVVHIAAEGGGGLSVRKRAWELHRGRNAPDFRILSASPMVDDPENVRILAAVIAKLAEIKGKATKLIILDTLNRTLGGEENSATDMAAYLRGCEKLRDETGASVMVLHHPGHNGTRARGSSALFAGMDFEIALEGEAGAVTMAANKMKDAELPAPIGLKMVKVDLPGVFDPDGQQVDSLVANLATFGDQLKAASKLKSSEQLVIDLVEKLGKDGVAPLDVVRDSFKGSPLIDGKSDPAKRQAFSRAIEHLTEKARLINDGCFLRLIQTAT